MGRGDMRTKKGKRFAGSFGVVRSARVAETISAEPAEKKEKVVKAPATKKAAPKKKAAEKE